jgi:hypothetical protein
MKGLKKSASKILNLLRIVFASKKTPIIFVLLKEPIFSIEKMYANNFTSMHKQNFYSVYLGDSNLLGIITF